MNERRDAWIQTYSGKQFHPLDPSADEIDIVDIAHALSNACRFNGHCARHYSVAEHSIHVALHVAWDDEPTDRATVLTALLHDASEAYLCDIPKPLKTTQAMAPYRAMESKVEFIIAAKFGLPDPMPDIIKRHDLRALATEYRDLVPAKFYSWHLPEPAWSDIPRGCLRTTETAFDGMGIDAQAVHVRSLFLAMYRHLSGDTSVIVNETAAEQADWLLRRMG